MDTGEELLQLIPKNKSAKYYLPRDNTNINK